MHLSYKYWNQNKYSVQASKATSSVICKLNHLLDMIDVYFTVSQSRDE